MPSTSRPPISVHLLPSLIPADALRGGVAIVVDVLRATTVMVEALAGGAEAIIPCLEIDEARTVAAGLTAGSAILGGERKGLPIEGFDLGNSPPTYTPEVCRGKTLVMTTTNGTRAILASLDADRVLVAAFTNGPATCAAVRDDTRPIHVVCSGTDGQVSFEDALLAGQITENLLLGREHGNDVAVAAREMWLRAEAGIERSLSKMKRSPEAAEAYIRQLAQELGRYRGGSRLRELALWQDVLAASRVGSRQVVAELRRDPLGIVRVG